LVGLSRVAWERNELGSAAEQLRRADDLGESAALPQNPYRWRVAMARLREAEGDPATALGLLEEAERVYVGDYSPDVQPVAAVRARMLAAHGQVDEALAWARRAGLTSDDELSYLHEFEHVTLARILLEQRSPEALGLLDRLLTAAEQGGRTRTVIELLVLKARAVQDPAPLERALSLAEPGGWVRVFVGEGEPVTELLDRVGGAHQHGAFLRKVLEAAQTGTRRGSETASPADRPTAQSLVDPLSDRELDVLRLLATDLDGPGIARHLVVSLNTVRTHTKHIYTKLGVNNRRSAVSRAHQLGLLAR
jgi:LuxR family maltose regulon positive regulatory protein